VTESLPASLRIGELAKRTGTTPRTIRYYEEMGLLPAAESREAGSHRTYGPEHLERMEEIVRLKDLLGVSLEELRELVTTQAERGKLRREWDEGVEDPVRRRELLAHALELVETQLGLVRGRLREVKDLEGELLEKKKRIRARLRQAQAERVKAW
jgi:MerR family transcriptional regulator, repressor of the yfmOP operon